MKPTQTIRLSFAAALAVTAGFHTSMPIAVAREGTEQVGVDLKAGGVDKQIAELTAPYSGVVPGTSAQLADLEAAAEVSRQVTALLVEQGDLRGIFGVGLDTVEEEAVLPYERTSSNWAPTMSANLIFRYLSAVHAEFSGQPVPEQWKTYFDAAKTGSVGPDRVAMMGYNAHLTVDLANAVADSGTTQGNYPEYTAIVAAIADTADQILTNTKATYGIDILPAWWAAGVDTSSRGVRGQAVRLGDQGYTAISFQHGLGMASPLSSDMAQGSVMNLWRGVHFAITRA